MHLPFPTSLGRRLALLIVGFSSLVAIFTTGVELYVDYRNDRSELDLMLEHPPLSVESIGRSLWDFDEAHLMLSIEALSRLPNVVFVEVVSADPKTRKWSAGSPTRPEKRDVERHFNLSYSATDGPRHIGSLIMVASLEHIHQRLFSRIGIVLAGNFLKTLLVAAFMMLLFRRLITDRIDTLSAHVQEKASILLNDAETPLPLVATTPPFVAPSGDSHRGPGDDYQKEESDEIDRLSATFERLCQRVMNQSEALASEVEQQTDLLSQSEQRFRSFVENVNDVLFALTRDGVFTYVSPQWTTAFGYALDETIGQAFPPFVHPDDIPACAEFLQRVMTTGEKLSGVEYRVRCKAGDYVWYRANASRIIDPKTSEPLLVGIGRDITQLKESREALAYAKREAERANLAKTRFLAAASHDLRQPVTAIKLFCDSLSKTPLTQEQQQIAHYLSQSAAGMAELLESLLDVSAVDAGQLEPRIRMLPVLDLMARIETGFAPIAQSKSLRFKLSFPERNTVLYSDEQLLVRLLGNLIGNAIKYTERGGILVGVRRRGDHALFQVWDTGRGISLEHISGIFEEYYQVGNPERDVAKGLGLGLAIALRLARLLGTEIRCRSRLGHGSVFEFSLPLISVRHATTPSSSSGSPAA